MFAAKKALTIALILAALLIPAFTHAEAPAQKEPACNDQEKAADKTNYITAFEYYYPKNGDRQIHSVFSYTLFGYEFVNKLHYSLYGGIVWTYAWGNIEQWDDNFNTKRFDANASGIGPIFLIEVDFLRLKRFYISGDLLFGIILYNTNFPPGGDIYNLFFKIGPSFGFVVSDTTSLNLGIRFMHVSNGQGLGNFNPSYEGIGLSFSVQKSF